MFNRYYFTKNHIWVDIDEDIASIGITDYAQEKLGSILFVNLPNVNDEIHENEAFGDIESVKTVHDLIAPIDGVVVECNGELEDDPNIINYNPLENWLIRVRIDYIPEGLLNKDEYLAYMERGNS